MQPHNSSFQKQHMSWAFWYSGTRNYRVYIVRMLDPADPGVASVSDIMFD